MPKRSIAHLATELYLTENHPHVMCILEQLLIIFAHLRFVTSKVKFNIHPAL